MFCDFVLSLLRVSSSFGCAQNLPAHCQDHNYLVRCGHRFENMVQKKKKGRLIPGLNQV
jgi:hypothetical protein